MDGAASVRARREIRPGGTEFRRLQIALRKGEPVTVAALGLPTTAEATDEYAGVGRNAPCPCGSGKKFKMCHGRSAS